jgi:hypothetical protein
MENVVPTVEETVSVPQNIEANQVNNVQEPVEKKEANGDLTLEAGNVSDANTAEKQEIKQEEVVVPSEEKKELVESVPIVEKNQVVQENKTPAKEVKTPAKKEKKTADKKEKAASTTKKPQNKQDKSTAKKEKATKLDDVKEKQAEENKNGNKNTVKRSKSVNKTEVKPELKKAYSAEITLSRKNRKADSEEYLKYSLLLNKKTSRKSKKE